MCGENYRYAKSAENPVKSKGFSAFLFLVEVWRYCLWSRISALVAEKQAFRRLRLKNEPHSCKARGGFSSSPPQQRKKTAKAVFGPSDTIWTCDLQYPKLARYQLRYTRKWYFMLARFRYPKPALPPSAFVSHSFARQASLALLATRDIASVKTTLSCFRLALQLCYTSVIALILYQK